MGFSPFLKSILLTAGIALGTSAASAATVASLVITGGEATGAVGEVADEAGVDTTALALSGDFDAFIDLGFDPDSEGDYTLAADLTVGGFELFNESITLFTTGTDLLLEALDLAATIEAIVPGLLGSVIEETFDGDLAQTEIFPDVWFGIDFDLTDADITDGTIAGSFSAVLSEQELAEPDVLISFTTPETFSGSATVSFDDGLGVIPLPASAPLLLGGLIGLLALRRRAT